MMRFNVVFANVETDETMEFPFEPKSSTYTDAWREVVELAIAVLKRESPAWVIDRITEWR